LDSNLRLLSRFRGPPQGADAHYALLWDVASAILVELLNS